MLWKLRGDYTFYTNRGPMQNELDRKGNVIKARIVDDSQFSIAGQEGKFEPAGTAVEEKPKRKPRKPREEKETVQWPKGGDNATAGIPGSQKQDDNQGQPEGQTEKTEKGE